MGAIVGRGAGKGVGVGAGVLFDRGAGSMAPHKLEGPCRVVWQWERGERGRCTAQHTYGAAI
jgi:hypothetical protein